jgi:heme A synthase
VNRAKSIFRNLPNHDSGRLKFAPIHSISILYALLLQQGRGQTSQSEGKAMKSRKMKAWTILLFVVPALSGCCVAAAAGAGAYGGYKAKESGYSLQSPVAKDGVKKSENKESE